MIYSANLFFFGTHFFISSSEIPSETIPEEPSITELKATGKLIETLQKGWDTIHFNSQTNVQKAKVRYELYNFHLQPSDTSIDGRYQA